MSIGNALDERVLRNAELESRQGAIGTLTNEAVSLLFVEKAYREYRVPHTYVAIQRGHGSISPGMIEDAAARVLFGNEADLDLWSVRIRRGTAGVQKWSREPANGGFLEGGTKDRIDVPRELQNAILPMSVHGGESVEPISHRTRLQQGDVVSWLVFSEREDEAGTWLSEHGWQLQQGTPSGKNT